MGISSTGIGSGLDVNTIVRQLMNAERGPISLLQIKQTANNAKLSAFGSLKSAVSTFQTALKALNGTSIGARTASSSSATTLGVSAGGDAVPGTYAIQVTQLAMQNKLASAGDIDPTALLGAGTMSIQVGSKPAVAIPSANYSLRSLSDAINAANAGVSAAIVNNGTTNRLVITANDPGAANTIQITATDNDSAPTPGLAKFQYPPAAPLANPQPGMIQSQKAQNAEFTVDTIVISRPSNTITDAISGVTLNLLQPGSSNVAVAVDKASAKTAVTAFVDAYNKLNSTIKNMTSYNIATKTGAVLNGESGASGIVTALRKQMTAAVTGSSGLTSLTDIGVSFQRDGTLAADDVKLSKALDTNLAAVTALFAGTDGYATRLTALTTDILGANGVISGRTAGLNDAIKQNSARQDDFEVRLSQTEKRYRAQFSALDSMMSKMQSTSSFLTQQLRSLANNS